VPQGLDVEVHDQSKSQASRPEIADSLRDVNAVNSFDGLGLNNQLAFNQQVDAVSGD
jgi:hypothetical protein